ncbi:MAG: uroporphyrinogen decarboxylase family protein [Anaerolineae bacterium]
MALTGKQRLEAILAGKPADRLAWTTLADNTTLDIMPPELRGNGGLDLYRYLGMDMLLLNGFGLPELPQSPRFSWGPRVTEVTETQGDVVTTTWHSPWGTLKSVYRKVHPIKYAVTTLEEVRIYRAMWEEACYTAQDDAEVYRKMEKLVGDDGVTPRYWGPSTIPRLLENDMGTQAYYLLANDYPEEIDGLVNTMHAQELEAFRILATGPADTVILVENTSTFFISPALYRRHNGRHVADFCRIVRNAGKQAIIHMCGQIRHLLPDIATTGLQGVHGLTPPTVGDTPYELYLDIVGEDQVIIGILDPVALNTGTRDDIWHALDAMYTPRLRKSHFILWAACDGLTVQLWRFEAVRDWMERFGEL